jgi:hypothetical protein
LSKDDKLNLIIMRDDSRVRRYRIRVSWFKFFLYAQIVLILVAGLGAYGGFTYWVKKLELVQANSALREDISEMQIHLERLQNIENILRTSDPAEIQALFSSMTREKQALAQQAVDLQEIFVAKDLQIAGVSNLQIQRAGGGLRLRFELNNLGGGTLVGMMSVYYVVRDATLIQAQGEKGEFSFEIQRFRKVNSMLQLPPGVTLENIFALRLEIKNNKGESIFIQTYPLEDILTS